MSRQKKIQDEGNPFRHQRERRLQRDGGAVKIEGKGLAGATECTRSVAIGE